MKIPENAMDMMDGMRALMGSENVDNLMQDFQLKLAGIQEETGRIPNEKMIGTLLCGFCLGVNNTMNPRSHFNRQFKPSAAYPTK